MIPRNLLPDDYYDGACIAGGYAACPALASDMDVWVFVPSYLLEDARALILEHLSHYGFSYTKEERERQRAEGTDPGGYDVSGFILKVARVSLGHETIHILVTSFPGVLELLSSFDVSTHQVALTDAGVIRGGDWTPITEPPVKLKDSPTTDERMRKIARRYGHEALNG